MSKISIKTDFADGDKLFAQDLNNNFLVIQAGVNANEENLQAVIDQAIKELDAELEEITADRGWDWNGGNRVTFYKGNTAAITARDIVNGQLLYNTETGETALDDNGSRIVTGSGNVVSIGETEPTNPATKLWVQPSKMVSYAASYVVNNMSGSDIDKSPSVNAVKNYVDKNIYSTTETVVGTWLGKPLYRKVIEISSLPNNADTSYETGITNGELARFEGFALLNSSDTNMKPLPYISPFESYGNIYLGVDTDAAAIKIKTGSNRTSGTAKVIVEYTKTTD